MISNSKYEEILSSGLSLDHYLILCSIKNNAELPDSKRIQGFINLLIKKGYMADDGLTELGEKLVENCHSNMTYPAISWATELHKKLQDRILELTGKKQKFMIVGNNRWPFLCNPKEIEAKIEKVKKMYGLTDMEKIEKCLLKHCENNAPTIFYYILREKPELHSQLATDYQNIDDETLNKPQTSTQKFI